MHCMLLQCMDYNHLFIHALHASAMHGLQPSAHSCIAPFCSSWIAPVYKFMGCSGCTLLLMGVQHPTANSWVTLAWCTLLHYLNCTLLPIQRLFFSTVLKLHPTTISAIHGLHSSANSWVAPPSANSRVAPFCQFSGCTLLPILGLHPSANSWIGPFCQSTPGFQPFIGCTILQYIELHLFAHFRVEPFCPFKAIPGFQPFMDSKQPFVYLWVAPPCPHVVTLSCVTNAAI